MAIIVNFSLSENDSDILSWLEGQPNKSASIRAAIRSYMAKTEGPTLGDVLMEIRALSSKLASGAVVVSEKPQGEEPQTAANNLDGLMGRLDDFD